MNGWVCDIRSIYDYFFVRQYFCVTNQIFGDNPQEVKVKYNPSGFITSKYQVRYKYRNCSKSFWRNLTAKNYDAPTSVHNPQNVKVILRGLNTGANLSWLNSKKFQCSYRSGCLHEARRLQRGGNVLRVLWCKTSRVSLIYALFPGAAQVYLERRLLGNHVFLLLSHSIST